jgi:aspartyl-tRNA(Asn)/glutamyl-tRNA(Gln) amidotransferase subunit B
VLVADPLDAKYFERLLDKAVEMTGKPEQAIANTVANWQVSIAPGVVNAVRPEHGGIYDTAEASAKIIALQDKGEISGGQAKEIYEIVLMTGRDPDEIADTEGLKQTSDSGAIDAKIDEILAANADKVEQYKAGKEALFGFFVGQTMKAMQGKANPQVVNERLRAKLG